MTAYRDINEALPALMKRVLVEGDEVGSRNGRTKELLFQQITLTEPTRREILLPYRRASLPAQIAETMWVLSGRDDVAWLRNYLPRADDFSDDGERWRGAYGPRIRNWGAQYEDSAGGFDQLKHVVDLLRADPATRRAVIAIYDPATDSAEGKDIPCNNWLHFLSRNGRLDLHVAIRSNDLMWGFSGINAFEWSVLLEIVAKMTGLVVGSLHFSISSLHLYDKHWSRANRIQKDTVLAYAFPGERYHPDCVAYDMNPVSWLDHLIGEWFRIEELIRDEMPVAEKIANYPEPMFRSWLSVLADWWNGDAQYLSPIVGTPLYTAAVLSPPRPPGIQVDNNFTITGELTIGDVTFTEPLEYHINPPAPPKPSFPEYVANLHAEKHAVYGDSWRKRGEPGILANIARKVDRLEVAGGGDTAVDTAVDMLVYLIKYQLWMDGKAGDDSHVADVREMLFDLDKKTEERELVPPEKLVRRFNEIENFRAISLAITLKNFLPDAYGYAKSLWEVEQQ